MPTNLSCAAESSSESTPIVCR